MIYLPHRRKAFRSSFSPNNVSGLKMWYDCSQESYGNGVSVDSLTDRSGSGITLSNTGSARPTFYTGVSNGTKTFKATLFGPDLTVLLSSNIDAATLTTSGTDVTVFCALSIATRTYDGVFNIGSTDTRSLSYVKFDTDLQWNSGNLYGARLSVAAPVGYNSAWHVLCCRRSGNECEIILDGTSLASGTKTGSVYSESVPFYLGSISSAGLQFHDGYIAEFALYSTAITSGDITSVTSYLKSKYGIA